MSIPPGVPWAHRLSSSANLRCRGDVAVHLWHGGGGGCIRRRGAVGAEVWRGGRGSLWAVSVRRPWWDQRGRSLVIVVVLEETIIGVPEIQTTSVKLHSDMPDQTTHTYEYPGGRGHGCF
jgi:hypothetical protein